MHKTFFTVLICVIAFGMSAQVKRPKKSPLQKIEQRIGMTNIQLE